MHAGHSSTCPFARDWSERQASRGAEWLSHMERRPRGPCWPRLLLGWAGREWMPWAAPPRAVAPIRVPGPARPLRVSTTPRSPPLSDEPRGGSRSQRDEIVPHWTRRMVGPPRSTRICQSTRF